MDNGITIIGTWNEGDLEGHAVISTPFSALIFANFQKGKLHGWTISKYKDNIEIQHYTNNKPTTKTKIIYEGFEGLWVRSLFNEQRKFMKVIDLEKIKNKNEIELPSFADDDSLHKMFNLVFKYKKFLPKKKKIVQMRIDKKF